MCIEDEYFHHLTTKSQFYVSGKQLSHWLAGGSRMQPMMRPKLCLSLWEGAQDPGSLDWARGRLNNRNSNGIRKVKCREDYASIPRKMGILKKLHVWYNPRKTEKQRWGEVLGTWTWVMDASGPPRPSKECRQVTEMTPRRAKSGFSRPWTLNILGL